MVIPTFRRLVPCLAAGLALLGAGCGDDDASSAAADEAGETAAGETVSDEPSGWDEPDYDGLPDDLTADEVCALLDEATVAEHVQSEVTGPTAGTRHPDCQWFYKIDDGPATNLHLQVMSMDQTDERVGSEALEWALRYGPGRSEVSEIAGLDVPNATYEFGASTIYLVVDPAGRVFTLAAHSDTPEAGRIALVEAALAALAADHS